MAAIRQYNPTGPELADAISLTLKSTHEPPSIEALTKALEEGHPSWKFPERRVAKFLKKELGRTQNMSREDDRTRATTDKIDDASIAASPRGLIKKAGSSFRSLFSSKEELTTTSVEKKSSLFLGSLKSLINKKQKVPEGVHAETAEVVDTVEEEELAALAVVDSVEEEIGIEEAPPQSVPVEPKEPEQDFISLGSAPLSKDVIYIDDNDGKHEAALCGGCVIF